MKQNLYLTLYAIKYYGSKARYKRLTLSPILGTTKTGKSYHFDFRFTIFAGIHRSKVWALTVVNFLLR